MAMRGTRRMHTTAHVRFQVPEAWRSYVGHYRSEDPWIGSLRVVVLKGRLMLDGLTPLELDGDLFRLRDEPANTEWIRFGEVVNGKCMRLKLLRRGSVARRQRLMKVGITMHTHRFALLLSVLIAAPVFAAETAADARIKQVENRLLPQAALKANIGRTITLEQRMRDLGIAGISIAVIDEGKIAWTRAYGVRDTVDKTPVTVDTLFQAGSISKPVAALGALRLVKDGKLTLDGDVNEKLKTWRVPDNEFTKDEKVTLRRLTSHTAGLTVHGFGGYAVGTEVPTVVQVLDGQPPANSSPVRVDVKPGSLYRYSGGGYTVMQLLIADVANESFESFMQSKVLDVLGMKSSTFSQSPPPALAARRASAHRPGGQRIPGKLHIYPEMAAAGLWTTPSDLARYLLYVQAAVRGETGQVLTAALAKELVTRQNSGRHGLGPSISATGEFARFGRGGVDKGFEADMVAYVARGQGVVRSWRTPNSRRCSSAKSKRVSRAPMHGRVTRSNRRSRPNPSRKPCWNACPASINSTRRRPPSSMRETGGCSSTSSTSAPSRCSRRAPPSCLRPRWVR